MLGIRRNAAHRSRNLRGRSIAICYSGSNRNEVGRAVSLISLDRSRPALAPLGKGLPLGFDEIVEGSKPEEDNIPKQTPRERLRAEAASLEKKTKEREAKWKFTSPYQDKPARKK